MQPVSKFQPTTQLPFTLLHPQVLAQDWHRKDTQPACILSRQGQHQQMPPTEIIPCHVVSLPLHQHRQFLPNCIPCVAHWSSLAHEFCTVLLHLANFPDSQNFTGHNSNDQFLGLD